MVDAETIKKNWRELTITSDFIFENVIQMSDNCLNLIRAILPELDLKGLKRAEIQKPLKDKKDMHGVRFDAFAEDQDGHVFEMEMQAEKEEALGLRIRYYQSKIDISSLREGKDYKHLSKSFVIFLMNYDHFGRGQYRYVFHNREGDFPDLKLEDGQTWIVLNSKGRIGQITMELKEFFALMNGIGNPSTEFVKQIVHDIERVKADPAKERAYMDMQMKLMKAKEQGLEQGINKGLEQGINKGMQLGFIKANYDNALKMASFDHASGLSEREIASKLRMIFSDLDEDQFQQIISQLKK